MLTSIAALRALVPTTSAEKLTPLRVKSYAMPRSPAPVGSDSHLRPLPPTNQLYRATDDVGTMHVLHCPSKVFGGRVLVGFSDDTAPVTFRDDFGDGNIINKTCFDLVIEGGARYLQFKIASFVDEVLIQVGPLTLVAPEEAAALLAVANVAEPGYFNDLLLWCLSVKNKYVPPDLGSITPHGPTRLRATDPIDGRLEFMRGEGFELESWHVAPDGDLTRGVREEQAAFLGVDPELEMTWALAKGLGNWETLSRQTSSTFFTGAIALATLYAHAGKSILELPGYKKTWMGKDAAEKIASFREFFTAASTFINETTFPESLAAQRTAALAFVNFALKEFEDLTTAPKTV